ncbi:hypothetical protein D3C81_1333820 [compost metagenome]
MGIVLPIGYAAYGGSQYAGHRSAATSDAIFHDHLDVYRGFPELNGRRDQNDHIYDSGRRGWFDDSRTYGPGSVPVPDGRGTDFQSLDDYVACVVPCCGGGDGVVYHRRRELLIDLV